MDTSLLPKGLQPSGYPINVSNQVTGYRTYLYRTGTSADFVGWIELVNGDQPAGYIYIRQPLSFPSLGALGYVVMDTPPDNLGPLLQILQSGELLDITFFQASAGAETSAALMHRP